MNSNLPDESFGPLDRFFRARIDHALDEARPLDALTDWYARRRPGLWEYYETMLDMELELRFPGVRLEESVQTVLADSKKRRAGFNSRKKRLRTILAVSIVLLVLVYGFYFVSVRPLSPVEISLEPIIQANANIAVESTDTFNNEQRIDLADLTSLVVASLSEALPSGEVSSELSDELSGPWPSGGWSFRHRPLLAELPTWERSVEPLVEFSEQPLESTLVFLERIQLLRRKDIGGDAASEN